MPVEITKAQIAELRGLLAKATPGPWRTHLVDDTTIVADGTGEVATTWQNGGVDADADFDAPTEQYEADAALIVAMRNALPALLDAAERAETAREDALKKATKIAQGDTVHEIFREWPWLGNRARDSEITRHSDAIANAILALIDNPKGGDANARSDDSQSKPTLHATSPGVTAGASVVEDDLCGRLRVYALAEDIMSSERRDLETAATRIRSLSAQLAEARREIEAFDVQEMGYAREIEHLAARAIAAESEAAALREALKPFAHAAEYLESETEGFTDDDPLTLTYRNEEACATDIGTVLQFGHFRRARTALDGRS